MLEALTYARTDIKTLCTNLGKRRMYEQSIHTSPTYGSQRDGISSHGTNQLCQETVEMYVQLFIATFQPVVSIASITTNMRKYTEDSRVDYCHDAMARKRSSSSMPIGAVKISEQNIS